MKFFLFFLLLSTSIFASEMPNNFVLQMKYHDVEVKKVVSATAHLKYMPASSKGIASYIGMVVITAVIEGNLCGALPDSVGTLFVFEVDRIILKLIAGIKAKNETIGCQQPTSNATVSFTIPIHEYDIKGNGVVKVAASIPYVDRMPPGSQGVAKVILTAQGADIAVNVE